MNASDDNTDHGHSEIYFTAADNRVRHAKLIAAHTHQLQRTQ